MVQPVVLHDRTNTADGGPPHRPALRYPIAILVNTAGVEAFRQWSHGQHWAHHGRPLHF